MFFSLASGRQQPPPTIPPQNYNDPRGGSYNDTPTSGWQEFASTFKPLEMDDYSKRRRNVPLPNPNAYYEWRGFVPDVSYGDLFGGLDESNFGGGLVVDRYGNYTRYDGLRPFGYNEFSTPKSPTGIWQQRKTYAPFKDLAAAQKFEYQKAQRDADRLNRRTYQHPTWTRDRMVDLREVWGNDQIVDPDEGPVGWQSGLLTSPGPRAGNPSDYPPYSEWKLDNNLFPKAPAELRTPVFIPQQIHEAEPYYPQLFTVEPLQPIDLAEKLGLRPKPNRADPKKAPDRNKDRSIRKRM